MSGWRGGVRRWTRPGLGSLLALGLLLAGAGPGTAEGAPAWEALGPPDTPIEELF